MCKTEINHPRVPFSNASQAARGEMGMGGNPLREEVLPP